jgi:hypothetical protein
MGDEPPAYGLAHFYVASRPWNATSPSSHPPRAPAAALKRAHLRVSAADVALPAAAAAAASAVRGRRALQSSPNSGEPLTHDALASSGLAWALPSGDGLVRAVSSRPLLALLGALLCLMGLAARRARHHKGGHPRRFF